MKFKIFALTETTKHWSEIDLHVWWYLLKRRPRSRSTFEFSWIYLCKSHCITKSRPLSWRRQSTNKTFQGIFQFWTKNFILEITINVISRKQTIENSLSLRFSIHMYWFPTSIWKRRMTPIKRSPADILFSSWPSAKSQKVSTNSEFNTGFVIFNTHFYTCKGLDSEMFTTGIQRIHFAFLFDITVFYRSKLYTI